MLVLGPGVSCGGRFIGRGCTSATGLHGEHHIDSFVAGGVSGGDIGNESSLYFKLSVSIAVEL